MNTNENNKFKIGEGDYITDFSRKYNMIVEAMRDTTPNDTSFINEEEGETQPSSKKRTVKDAQVAMDEILGKDLPKKAQGSTISNNINPKAKSEFQKMMERGQKFAAEFIDEIKKSEKNETGSELGKLLGEYIKIAKSSSGSKGDAKVNSVLAKFAKIDPNTVIKDMEEQASSELYDKELVDYVNYLNGNKNIMTMAQKIANNDPFLIIGRSGWGKSQMIKQIANMFGLVLIDLRVAGLMAEDFGGQPISTNASENVHHIKYKENEGFVNRKKELNVKIAEILKKTKISESEMKELEKISKENSKNSSKQLAEYISQGVMSNKEVWDTLSSREKKEIQDIQKKALNGELSSGDFANISNSDIIEKLEGLGTVLSLDHSLPTWAIEMCNNPNQNYLLFLDEINQGDASVYNVLYQVVNDRRIGGIHMSNMLVCAAGNYSDELIELANAFKVETEGLTSENSDLKDIPSALMARFGNHPIFLQTEWADSLKYLFGKWRTRFEEVLGRKEAIEVLFSIMFDELNLKLDVKEIAKYSNSALILKNSTSASREILRTLTNPRSFENVLSNLVRDGGTLDHIKTHIKSTPDLMANVDYIAKLDEKSLNNLTKEGNYDKFIKEFIEDLYQNSSFKETSLGQIENEITIVLNDGLSKSTLTKEGFKLVLTGMTERMVTYIVSCFLTSIIKEKVTSAGKSFEVTANTKALKEADVLAAYSQIVGDINADDFMTSMADVAKELGLEIDSEDEEETPKTKKKDSKK